MSRHLPTKHELSIATSPCYGLVHGFRGWDCAALAHNELQPYAGCFSQLALRVVLVVCGGIVGSQL